MASQSSALQGGTGMRSPNRNKEQFVLGLANQKVIDIYSQLVETELPL
jgi:hypothetical protein